MSQDERPNAREGGAPAPLTVGVIGLGLRGRLAQGLPPEARVSVVCDPRAARREVGLGWYPDAVAVPTHHDLLDPASGDVPDAVVITTPDDTHEQIALDCLEAGVAVFVDKPLAITIEGCDRVLAAAVRTGTPLYVGHNMRHMPVITAMREILERGDIGEVKAIWCRHFVGHGGDFYFKDWHADRTRTTSLLLQKGAHDLDVIHWLGGGFTVRTHAMGSLSVYGDNPNRGGQGEATMPDWYDPEGQWPPEAMTGLHDVIDVEDLSMMTMQLDNGVLAGYQQCHFTPDYWRNYTVIGTRGRLENFGDHDGGCIKVWNARRSGYREDADLVVPIPEAAGGHGGADPRLLAEFVAHVRDGAPTLTSPIAARAAVAAGVAATRSLRSGGVPVDVPGPSEAALQHFSGRAPARPGETATTKGTT